MNKRSNNLKYLKFSIIGLALMIVGVVFTEGANLYKIKTLPLVANWATYLIGFIFVIVGLINLRKERKEFLISFVLSAIGLVCMIGSLLLIGKDYGAFGISVFIDLKIMFTKYIADICMLGVYIFNIKGLYQIMAKNKINFEYQRFLKRQNILIILILITMILIPFVQVFSMMIKIIFGVIVIFINALAKILILKDMLVAYNRLSEAK